MEEIWKDIKFVNTDGKEYDYTGLYEVSSEGRVRNSRTGRILKPGIAAGYQFVNLYKDGKKRETFSVHRLVATMFIPNPDNLPVVNHRDENKLNNCVDNLEWVTHKYNINYGTSRERASKAQKGKKRRPRSEETKCKISEALKVKVICLETKQIFDSLKEAQAWLGKGNIAVCLAGNAKTAGGYHWMYYEDWLELAN